MPNRNYLYPDSLRGRSLYEAQLREVQAWEDKLAGSGLCSPLDRVPVPMPLARFRREYFGAVAVQPLTQQLTNLAPNDCLLIEAVDGQRTVSEIELATTIAGVGDTFNRL